MQKSFLTDKRRYIVADYERQNFSIYQTLFEDTPAEIIPIHPVGGTPNSSNPSHHISAGAIAGIVIGSLVIPIIILIIFCLRRKQQPEEKDQETVWSLNSPSTWWAYSMKRDTDLPPELHGEALGELHGGAIAPVELHGEADFLPKGAEMPTELPNQSAIQELEAEHVDSSLLQARTETRESEGGIISSTSSRTSTVSDMRPSSEMDTSVSREATRSTEVND